jgi:outer membrane protein W
MKKLIIAAFFLAGITTAFAQEPAPKLYTLPSPYDRYVHYQVTARLTSAIPLGSFKSDYIDKASFENYSIALEWVLQNSFSVGGEIGYSYFKQRLPRAQYISGEQTVSAVQTRTLSQYPVQAFANYHFLGKDSSIQPYVQISGGASILDYTVYYGSLGDQKQKIRPTYGIGLGSKFLFKKDGSFGADVRVKYAGTSFKYDYLTSGVSSLNTSVGLFYRWW